MLSSRLTTSHVVTLPLSTDAVSSDSERTRISRVVYAGTAAWAIGFAVAACISQHLFLLRRYDLGNFTQAIWSTAHGHLLVVTEVGGANVTRLGIHVDPILFVLVPLWRLWSSPMMLLTVQALALAAGALPLYWLARKHLASSRDGALVAAAYLLCPAVGWNAAGEFHAVTLSAPLLLAAIWFLDERRMVPFALAAGAATLCQEQIGFVVAGLGLWYAWRSKRIREGATIAAFGALVSAVDFGIVLHHYSHGSPYYGRYQGVGGSFTGIVEKLFTHPLGFAGHLVGWADLLGIAFLVAPVLGLCFGSSIVLAAIPQVALLMLSDRTSDIDFSGQTVLPLIPFIYVGAVLALERHRSSGKWKAAHVLVSSIAIAAFLGPLNPLIHGLPDRAKVAAEQRAVELVPADAAVAATNRLGAHLAERRRLNVFPVLHGADWVLVDATDTFLPDMGWLRGRTGITVGNRDLYDQPKLMQRVVRRLNASPAWARIFTSHGISVFKRVRPSASS
jgi:uncharacterized membrane protein